MVTYDKLRAFPDVEYLLQNGIQDELWALEVGEAFTLPLPDNVWANGSGVWVKGILDNDGLVTMHELTIAEDGSITRDSHAIWINSNAKVYALDDEDARILRSDSFTSGAQWIEGVVENHLTAEAFYDLDDGRSMYLLESDTYHHFIQTLDNDWLHVRDYSKAYMDSRGIKLKSMRFDSKRVDGVGEQQ